MLTDDQAGLLFKHCGAWMLAATIVDPDYGISSIRGRAGGKAWPDGSEPELPYNYTTFRGDRIIGHTRDQTVVVSVSLTQVRRWAAQVPEPVKTELLLQFAAMADERNRNWCYCPYAAKAPNAHSEPCKRYHPTEAEEQRRRAVMAGLDARQAEWVQRALGLTGSQSTEIEGQLELFEVVA